MDDSDRNWKAKQRPLRVACLPHDVRRGEPNANVEAVLAGIAAASERGAHLLVLPELWPTSFPESGSTPGQLAARVVDDAAAWSAVERAAADRGLWLIGSGLASARGERVFNRARCLAPDGERAVYDKAHLFTPTAEHLVFAAGDGPCQIFEGPGGAALSMAICYDLRFGAWLTPLAAAGVEVLAIAAQWPSARAAHWRALVVGRAVELQCFVVACNPQRPRDSRSARARAGVSGQCAHRQSRRRSARRGRRR